jgi:hypothetical protein
MKHRMQKGIVRSLHLSTNHGGGKMKTPRLILATALTAVLVLPSGLSS